MNTKEKRIKLAEAMGWHKITDPDSMTQLGVPQPCLGDEVWTNPDNSEWVWPDNLPDPFTDANDCNALIKHLNGLGYLVTIEHGERIHVCVRNDNIVYDWRQKSDRYDWMHGVCELALEVIEK